MYTTDMYEGVLAETVTMTGANGDLINAYLAKPLGKGPFPAMVLVHHMPGWDQWYREATFKFAHHGYVTISPNLYFKSSAISQAQWNIFAGWQMSTERSASSAPALAGVTPTSPPAEQKASTQLSIAGADVW